MVKPGYTECQFWADNIIKGYNLKAVERIDWGLIVGKMMKWQWAVTAMVIAVGLGIWLVFSKNLPSQLPLFYSRPWGEDQLVETRGLWWPLYIAVLVAITATSVVKRLGTEKVLAAILIAAGTITEVILLMAVLRIVLLVT